MYIVKYTKGDWDDFNEVDIFVTESKELAEAYVEKFNTILKRWKSFFSKLRKDNKNDILMYTKNPILNRYWDVVEINEAKFEEIEQRYVRK